MKKFLSLVLALVMTMSLVTISAGAKDFTDADKVNYDEAIAVLSAVKVIDGYTDGSFKPQTPLNRGQAAKIICNLILGPTTASALVADVAPFKDVPADSTFAGYITYCAKEGIISGYTDGTFKPGNPLTGYAFMKMLLGALGYDADIEGYNNPTSWSISVAKQAIAIGLEDGLVEEFDGRKPVTREMACLFALNTLKATMVDYESKTTVSVAGAEVVIAGSTAKDVKWNIASKADGNIKGDGYVQFAEKYFPKLELEVGNGIYGCPANTWKENKKEIGTYTSIDATYVYTENTKSKDVYKDMGKAVVEDYTWTAFVNGEEVDVVKPTKNGDGDYTFTDRGAVTAIYVDADKETVVVCEINFYLGQVTKVKTDDDGEYITIKELSKQSELDKKTFYVEGFEEDDYVVFTQDLNDDDDFVIGEVFEPQTVTGEVKRVESDKDDDNKYLKMEDGEKHPYSGKDHVVYDLDETAKVTHPELNKEYVLYMDPNGYVLGYKLAEETVDQYLFVKDSDEELKDWVAKVVLTDATTPKVDLKDELKSVKDKTYTYVDIDNSKIVTPDRTVGTPYKYIDKNKVEFIGNGKVTTNIDNRVWKYSASDKGVYTLTYVENVFLGYTGTDKTYNAKINNGKAYVTDGDNNLIVDKKTVFVDTVNGKSYVGYDEVPSVDKALLAVVLDKNKVADVVFILKGDIYDTNATYFVLADDTRESGKFSDDNYWEYTKAYVDGEKTSLKITYDAVEELLGNNTDRLAKGVLYKATKTIEDGEYIDGLVLVGKYDGAGAYVAEADRNNTYTDYCGTVEAVGDNAFWIDPQTGATADKKVKFDTDDETVYVTVRTVKTLKADGSYKTEYKIDDGNISDLKKIDPDTKTTYSTKKVQVVKRVDDETARLVYIFWTEEEIRETKNVEVTVDANVTAVNGNAVANGKVSFTAPKGNALELTFTVDGANQVSKVTVDGTELKANAEGKYIIPELTKNIKVEVKTSAVQCVAVKDDAGAVIKVNGVKVETAFDSGEGYNTGISDDIVVGAPVTIQVAKAYGGKDIASIVVVDVDTDASVELLPGQVYTTTMPAGGLLVEIEAVEEEEPTPDTVLNIVSDGTALAKFGTVMKGHGSSVTGLKKGDVVEFTVVAGPGATGDDDFFYTFNTGVKTAASGTISVVIDEGVNTLKVEATPKTYTVSFKTWDAAGWKVQNQDVTSGKDGVTVNFTLAYTGTATNYDMNDSQVKARRADNTTVTVNSTVVADCVQGNPVTFATEAIANADAFANAGHTLYRAVVDSPDVHDAEDFAAVTEYIPGLTYYKITVPAVATVNGSWACSYKIDKDDITASTRNIEIELNYTAFA